MSQSKRVMAFDIGIKNLAYCIFEYSAADPSSNKIISWENINLFDQDGEVAAAAAAATPTCTKCKSKAKYVVYPVPGETLAVAGAAPPQPLHFCARHTTRKPLADENGSPYSTLPPLARIKEIVCGAVAAGAQPRKSAKREDWIVALRPLAALPVQRPPKAKAVTKNGLDNIHDAIRSFTAERIGLIATCDDILLENQPVFKNPTMKSVQILLYATLRDMIFAEGADPAEMHLVHAGKKVRGAAAGDAGYAARKEGSETRTAAWLSACGAAANEWAAHFKAAKKKSDLADALCMCLDFSESA